MTFRKSNGEKEEVKMLNYKTNVPEIDSENETLFKALVQTFYFCLTLVYEALAEQYKRSLCHYQT